LSCISAPLPVLRYNNNQIFYFQPSWAKPHESKKKQGQNKSEKEEKKQMAIKN
jgi:hypothetical protein